MNEQSYLMVRANFTDRSDVSYCIHGFLAIPNRAGPRGLQSIAFPFNGKEYSIIGVKEKCDLIFSQIPNKKLTIGVYINPDCVAVFNCSLGNFAVT